MPTAPSPDRRERSPEGRRVREGKYADRLAELESGRDAAKAAVAEQSDAEAKAIADLRAETAQLHVEIFLEEHDSTGAWKEDRFGRDIAKDLRTVSFERDAEGRMEVTHEDERSHLLIVNLGELDRLNASGAHALGDQGLKLGLQQIESSVRGILKQETARADEKRLASSYDIYRISGNDFGIILRDVDADDAEALRQTLSRERVSLEDVRPGEEAVPLTASRVSRADGIRILNDVGRIGVDGEEDFTPKTLIQAMQEKAQTLNDVEKVKVRSERALEKMLAVEQGKITEADAKGFFDAFLKKSLSNAFREDPAHGDFGFEQFKRLADERRGSLDVSPSEDWIHFVTERSMADAFDQLKARRAVGREIENRIAHKVASEVLKKEAHFGFVVDLEAGPVSSPDFEGVGQISGKAKLEDLARRSAELATHIGEGGKVAAEAERAAAALGLERAKRDASRTGLYTRAEYFRTMESALVEDKPVSTIAIDMAFLKYFDKEGGPATGNLAIEKTAEILDRVARSFDGSDIAVEAFRTGGDEFSLTIVGGNEQTVQDVVAKIRKYQQEAGRVPAQPGAKETYKAEGLQFNMGVRTAKSMSAFQAELAAAEIGLEKQGTTDGPNELAEYLMTLADKEVEINKSTDRILFLALRTVQTEASGDHRNLATLKAYSEKGVFGSAGMELVESLAKKLASVPDRVEDRREAVGSARVEILQFVIDQLEEKRKARQGVESLMDRRIEEAVQERYLEQRIGELEEEVRTLEAQLAAEKGTSKQLRRLVSAAEQERDAVVNLREKLTGNAPAETRRAA